MAEPESDDIIGLGLEEEFGTFPQRLECWLACLQLISQEDARRRRGALGAPFVPDLASAATKFVVE